MGRDHIPERVKLHIEALERGFGENPFDTAVDRMIGLGIAGDMEWNHLESWVHRARIREAYGPPFRTPAKTRGKLIVGDGQDGRRIRCRPQAFNGHCFTSAASGSGKTIKSYFLIFQLACMIRGLWLFDFRKREFGILRPYLARLGVDLIVLAAQEMRLNLLQVPRLTDPRSYAAVLVDALIGVLKLPMQASKLLLYILLELYREFGVLNGSSRFPVLAELRDAVAASTHGHPESRRAIVDSLNVVLATLPEVFQWRIGWEAEDLAKYKIAFDFSGVFVTMQNLLLNAIWLPLMFSRIQLGVSNAAMNLYIVCDEAARLCGTADGSLADVIGAIRGTGVGLDLSVQSADVTRAILSNTSNKFLGRCACANDYDVLAAAMGLTAEQRRWLPTHLETGMFVGQLSEGPLRRPFLFRVPHLQLTDCDGMPFDATGVSDNLPPQLGSIES